MSRSSLAIAYIPANPKHTGGSNGTIDLITVHGTVSPCVIGGARGNAHYFQDPDAGGAAHYIVDPAEIVCSVDEDTVAHHAPPNTGSIGVELCDWQGMGPDGPDVNLWPDQPHQAMLGLGAKLVRDIATRRSVALEWRTVEDLKAGRRNGITSHLNVALAYRKTTHTDPGKFFPTEQFMSLVTGGATVEPHPQEPEMVFMAQFKDDPVNVWLCEVQAHGNTRPNEPTEKYGTRTRVIDPPTFYRLAALGIPTRSGLQEGMRLFIEVV